MTTSPPSHGRHQRTTTTALRIGRIGVDDIQVFIQAALDDTEIATVVERLTRLVEAGYRTIDVVFDPAPDTPNRSPPQPRHRPTTAPTPTITPATPTISPTHTTQPS